MEVRSKRRLASEINVVPYIDVMLVLLIIFMVTAPLMTSGVDVELPETTNTEQRPPDGDPVILTVDKDGLMYLDVGVKQYDEPLSDDEVVTTVAAVVASNPDKNFYVKADRSVPFGPVLNAMDLLKQGGVSKASFSSTQKIEKKR